MPKQRREYFRLEYPVFLRPTLFFSNKKYDVLEISEYGMRFETEDVNGFLPGKKLTVSLKFQDDEVHICDGRIIRLNANEIIVNLLKPVPLYKIRSEHLQIIKNTRHLIAV